MRLIGEQLLVGGAYTHAEASTFARVQNVAKVRRWLFGSDVGRAALIPYYGEDRGVVSFFDVIQLMAIRDIRSNHHIGLDTIRQTIETAKQRGIDYPFAQRHQTFVF